MMIVEINCANVGSTGTIMNAIADKACLEGYKMLTCCADSKTNRRKRTERTLYIGNRFTRFFQEKVEELFGVNGLLHLFSTLKILNIIDNFNVDVIHLHNLHNSYINLPLLFNYIKRKKIKIIWTLHDCWSFTGHCPCFDMVGCDKWKTECCHCQQYRDYPKSMVDNSRYMYRLKKKMFTGIDNLTIITPSKWLAGLVKESFLKDYPVRVINNGIDLDTFKPTPGSFREKYGISPEKHIVLGVAFDWGIRKGLDVFVELANCLDSRKYQIVLVGTNDRIDKHLPQNIISIHRTENQKELAEIYTAADVFVNTTREDNYPTVNMEALACGTPVITYDTGGSPEMLDATCGVVVPKGDISALKTEIIRVCETKPYSTVACLKKAKEFDKNEKYKQYVELYNEMCKGNTV